MKGLGVTEEEQIFKARNVLIRKLILNGATIKKHLKPFKSYFVPWFDIEGVRAYLNSKTKEDVQVKQEKVRAQSACKGNSGSIYK